MGIAHVGDILRKLIRQFPVVQEAVPVPGIVLFPGAEVDFIDGHRLLGSMSSVPVLHIVAVVPVISLQARDDRGVRGTSLRIERVRIGFEAFFPVRSGDDETVDISFGDPGKEHSPDAFSSQLHLSGLFVPAGLGCDDGDCTGMRRPDGKFGALNAFLRGQMGS